MGGYGGEIVVTGSSFGPHHRPYVVRSLPPPSPSPFHSRHDLDFNGNGNGNGKGGRLTARGRPSAWCFSDPEMKRRKRVAGYKAYSVEAKVKWKAKRGWRWLKKRCHLLVHGY